MRLHTALHLAMVTATAAAFVAACGGGGGDGEATSSGLPSGKAGGSSKGGASGAGGGPGSSAGASAAGKGGGFSNAGSGGQTGQALVVSPPTAKITITSKTTPATQAFTATLDGAPVTVNWSLSTWTSGSIDAMGKFTSAGIVAGSVDVVATYGGKTGKAKLDLEVKLTETVSTGMGDPGPSPANSMALDGVPMAEATPSKILYPYDGTVFPRGLIAPILQFSPGATAPEDAKVTLSQGGFSWSGKVHLQNGAVPQLAVPQDVWDAALESAAGKKLELSVVKATGGKAYGPVKTSIVAATAALRGAVYYMTYHDPVGLYSVRPGVKQPAKQIVKGCVVCHSVSANGTRLSTGAEVDMTQPDYAKSGVYKVDSDGNASQLTGAPSGLGGDSRGLSHATWTPDGKYVLRSQSNFWGGVNQSAWKVDEPNKTLVPATVKGLGPDVAALIPAIAPDGKRYVFTTGPGGKVGGSPSRSLTVMDLAIDGATDTLSFSNPKVVLDNGATGSVTKYAAFLPDGNSLVVQEGENYRQDYDFMLPTWSAPDGDYKGSTGRLHLVRVDTKEHLELLSLNKGIQDIDRQRNYEPFVLPVAAGGYFWVVFTSIREYGNTYQGANVRKQLWVAAISTTAKPGEDPSHPPFYLPNQTDTPNERGFWALEPCRTNGATCETGDACCGGSCRPTVPNDPKSPKTCGDVPTGQCSMVSEKCTKTADCCDAAQGVTCINGFCAEPSPPG